MLSERDIKKWLAGVLIVIIAAADLLPISASCCDEEAPYETELVNDLDSDYAERAYRASGSNTSKASSSNAAAADVFADMPAIDSGEFTDWFFSHSSNAELWDWVMELLDAEAGEDYNLFRDWLLANESRFNEVMRLYCGDNPVVGRASLSTGDLWGEWNGDMAWSGSGTESFPYQITSLAELMGLSELVASGMSFADEYFELTNDIDLGNIQINSGNWNPIGWYQNKSELSGGVSHPFKGHFDGAGNTVSGLRIYNSSLNLSNVGLFGAVEGGSVQNLTIEAEDVYGADNVGILAGRISGDTIICNVTVKGYVHASEDAGGIAGEIAGDSRRNTTIENCIADGIVIYGSERTGYVGGIAGNVQKADLVDNYVYTCDGDGNRIQGKGYVGGIAGRMSSTNIYNAYVSGTIGGNGSTAVGGIVGKYESGNLITARFDGDISRTNNGTASREGTFVGTRESRHNFTYGTGSSDNISYLFTTSASKAKTVFGSNIDGDNMFTTAAHIGYWTNGEKKYNLVAGKTESGSGDTCFYEELESGIKHIVTNKLSKEFTASGYYAGLNFKLDHYAPGFQGEPVRGYLVSVPRIDARNANGTYDTDVATLTALPVSNNSYYRQIDKDNPAAVACGVTVSVSTAAKNSDGNRYQMVYAGSEAGSVMPPTYIDEYGNILPMNYVTGGTYSFMMPECDTELTAEYVKVTTALAMTPTETTVYVTHTRSGDRKSPTVITEVRDNSGILIARYIDGVQDTSVEVQPISIHAEHNNTGSTADKTVMWSVDDMDLLINASETGYTLTDARVMPNMNSAFIQSIINKEVQAQAEAGYANAIADTIYTRNAVVTAATNPVTTANNQTVYGNTKVTVSFRIVDNTTIRVEGLMLNKSNITYTITRTLTGDRLSPTETITASAPVVLTATLNPNRPFYKNVSWSDTESGKLVSLTGSGDYTQDCTVNVRYDAAGIENPAWIQNVINADNAIRAKDPYTKLSGSAVCTEQVTAVSEDQTNGHVSAVCDIIINFVTVDETVIPPEIVQLSQGALTFELVQTKTGKKNKPVITWSGTDAQQLTAVVYPDLADTDIYKPYNRDVVWSVGNAALNVSDGRVWPNLESEWIQQVISISPYTGTIEIPVTVTTVDGGKTAVCIVKVNVTVVNNTTSSGGGGGGGGGSSSNSKAVGTATAGAGGPGANSVTGTWVAVPDGENDVKWRFVTNDTVYSSGWAYIYNPNADIEQGQPSIGWFVFDADGYMLTGWYTDANNHVYYLNPVSDNTQGMMLTGWHWIDGKCCYFNEIGTEGCPYGSLLRNTTTPDGYLVNEMGEWIP